MIVLAHRASRIGAFALIFGLAACTHFSQPRSYVVFFESDHADLTPDARRVVAEVAASARDRAPSKIVVAGRADGNTAHDATLADQRAMAVIRALASQGVPAGKIEKEPDAPPSSERGVAAHQVLVTLLP